MQATAKAYVVFFGNSYDDTGMPNPYHPYRIFASDSAPGVPAIASAWEPSAGKCEHFLVSGGTGMDALEHAISTLKARHAALRMQRRE